MTLTPALLLAVLSGGFLFSVSFFPSKYHSARESGHKLYFRAVFYAIFLVTCAIAIWIFLRSGGPLSPALIPGLSCFELIITILDSKYRDEVLMLAFTLSPSGFLLNLFFIAPKLNLNGLLLKYIVSNRDFERLILRALSTSIPLLVTLESGKCYVGWAVRGIDPTEERKYIRILPLVSGYRGEDDHRVNFTTYYDEIIAEIDRSNEHELGHLESEDFEVVIPVNKIVSAHLFDLTAYTRFRTDSNDQPEGGSKSKEGV